MLFFQVPGYWRSKQLLKYHTQIYSEKRKRKKRIATNQTGFTHGADLSPLLSA
jgi:hypothetical protein